MKHYSEITFPVYRRYKNGLSWFRIDSPDSYEELQIMGSRVLRSQREVKILPDRNMIYDLVFAYHNFADEISAAEYQDCAEKAG